MDWSKTKSIFIVTFLLLNIFLGFQLVEKQTAGNINLIYRETLHELLEENNIEITLSNIEETKMGSPIIGFSKTFQLETLESQFENQEFTITTNERTVYSELENPYKLSENNLEASVESFLEDHVFNGTSYRFSSFDEEQGTIGFFQTYMDQPIDNHERGSFHLVLHVNEELAIDGYHQSYIEINQEIREQELLSLLQAIEILFDNQYIPANTVIEDAGLGFYSLLPQSGEFQVYAPMWRIGIGDTYQYVNAIDGTIQSN
ncbi:two-component system regulatory protein YycI [Evansella sp. AB-P1]|uniref:two-component system regulatory protein YycI n=1 Tax=Evansella sp. AB-P1 TaxID=3037653 RepID=UPI00241D6FDA|nr:two-component system regulatory protein YycI [Evansella sp. AB-P1]MDG5789432.1 two-component system regulatory protein YycI [Evansella sp. AB-P1]